MNIYIQIIFQIYIQAVLYHTLLCNMSMKYVNEIYMNMNMDAV